MKKIIAIIAAVTAIVIAGFLVAENSYSKEKIEFVGEAKNIEYYFEKMYFYNTLQDEFDATANLLNINAKVVALDENTKIQFKLPHKPIRVYELSADESTKKIKVNYDKENKLYTLSDLFESEICEYDIVVDYGLTKNIYCFQIYNKTYIENNNFVTTTNFEKSPYGISTYSEKVVVTTNSTEYQYDNLTFGFSIKNDESQPIKCSFFKLEKQIDNNWYSVDEFELPCNTEGYEKLKQQVETTIKPTEINTIKMPMALGAVFDLMPVNGLLSGTYRIVVPFNCDDKADFAVSNEFTIGYA